MGLFGRLKLVGVAVVVLDGAIGGAFALDVLGVPGVAAVDNRFTGISATTTTIETGIFGNKADYPFGENETVTGSMGADGGLVGGTL